MEAPDMVDPDAEKNATDVISIAERACANSLEFLQGSGVVTDQVRCRVLQLGEGAADVAEAVAAYCREQTISLCVVGSHGNGLVLTQAPQRLVGLGSVSDSVVSKMACAVCVVRPQQWLDIQRQRQQGQNASGSQSESAV
jgi:nucleotide-binding universal stress UspA family protein